MRRECWHSRGDRTALHGWTKPIDFLVRSRRRLFDMASTLADLFKVRPEVAARRKAFNAQHERLMAHLRLYSDLGLRVFPCRTIVGDEFTSICSCRDHGCANPGKHPTISGYVEWATSNWRRLVDWWVPTMEPRRNSNIGLLTGPMSGVWILDVDVKPGVDGAANLQALIDKNGPLPATVQSVSGSRRPGARHYFFKWDDRLTSSLGFLPGLDVLAGGSKLAILPPSQHISGNLYAFVKGHTPIDLPFAAAPEWLVQAILSANKERLANAEARRQRWAHADAIEPGPRLLQYRAAVRAYNAEHTQPWPATNGPCPVCGSGSGFKQLLAASDTEAARWVCHSTKHQTLSPTCGSMNSDGSYSGTQIDIDAYLKKTGVKSLLVQGGYYRL